MTRPKDGYGGEADGSGEAGAPCGRDRGLDGGMEEAGDGAQPQPSAGRLGLRPLLCSLPKFGIAFVGRAC